MLLLTVALLGDKCADRATPPKVDYKIRRTFGAPVSGDGVRPHCLYIANVVRYHLRASIDREGRGLFLAIGGKNAQLTVDSAIIRSERVT